LVAELKSHVLLREEKGFLGIPFKRLLLAGVGGGLVYTLGKLALPDWAFPLAIGVGLLFLYSTAPQGGLPRWQRLLYRLQGSLMLAAARHPNSLKGQIAGLLELPSELAGVDGDALYAPAHTATTVDLAEWVTFARAEDAAQEDGLVLVSSPSEVK
jgi:hypothetical protein